MPIIIENLGAIGDADILGAHRYWVRINDRVLVEYEHVRSKGAAECLRAAAKAIEDSGIKRLLKAMAEAEEPEESSA